MPAWRRILLALALLAAGGAARADEVRLHLIAHGAIEADITVSHALDGEHFCSAAADPWTAPDVGDTRPAPYPFYRLIYGQAARDANLARPGPSIGLALSNYFTAARDHSDPVNDSIEMVIDGHDFVGHAGLQDPGYRFAVSYRDDRAGGGFVARHLHPIPEGPGTLDVVGTWECPPVAADMPEQVVSVHALFSGAVPVRPDLTPLRLTRSDIPCLDRDCARWRVTNEETGDAYLARVDFSRLRLAKLLRKEVAKGEIDLLIGADVHRGQPPRVVAVELDGVVPARTHAPPPELESKLAEGAEEGFPFAKLHDLIRPVRGKPTEPARHLAD